MGDKYFVHKVIFLFTLALAAVIAANRPLAAVRLVVSMSSVHPSLWQAGPPQKGKGGGKGQQQPIAPQPFQGAGGAGGGGKKGTKRTASNSRKGSDGSGQKGNGYIVGFNRKPRMAANDTYPFGTGATDEQIALLANGSQFPGLLPQTENGPNSGPEVYTWVPCLNEACTAPTRQRPPFKRAGVTNFSLVSNPAVKCKFCYVQFLPLDTQKVIDIFQKVLVRRLGGALGPLHPKFKGSKVHAQALLALEGDGDPTKPPLGMVSPSSPSWPVELDATLSIGSGNSSATLGPTMSSLTEFLNSRENLESINARKDRCSSQEAKRRAKQSLASLEAAVASGQVDLDEPDFAALSKVTSTATIQAAEPEAEQGQQGADGEAIYHYLKKAIEQAEEKGDLARASAMQQTLENDFPQGPPAPPKIEEKPVKPLSAPNELNLLSTKSAQALASLISKQKALECAKDAVVAAQQQLNHAKELATKAEAEVNYSLAAYQLADEEVKNFTLRVARKETERRDQMTKIIADADSIQQVPPPPLASNQQQQEQTAGKGDQQAGQTYAAVVSKGAGKSKVGPIVTDPNLVLQAAAPPTKGILMEKSGTS